VQWPPSMQRASLPGSSMTPRMRDGTFRTNTRTRTSGRRWHSARTQSKRTVWATRGIGLRQPAGALAPYRTAPARLWRAQLRQSTRRGSGIQVLFWSDAFRPQKHPGPRSSC
jgi:hypothetical protein